MILLLLALAAAIAPVPDDLVTLAPIAKVQTDPVPTDGDSADDPAIWVHPADPAKSLIIATNKKGGLHAHGLDGRERQAISPSSRPNNVNLLLGFPLGGRKVDLAVASVRGKEKGGVGVKVWTIEPEDGRLAELGPGATFPAFDGRDAYGLCTYKSPRDGASYVFVTDHGGGVEQYRLTALGGTIKAGRVRSFRVGSQSEGCVADRETGRLYIGEEDVALWEYGAEPNAGDARTLVARVGDHGLAADIEGLAIYYAAGGKGYILASSQGSNTFLVFERAGKHEFVATIDPKAGAIGDVGDSDGIDVTNEPTSPAFPLGLMVVQDGKNPGRQNFKLFSWDDVACRVLRVDTTVSSRKLAR